MFNLKSLRERRNKKRPAPRWISKALPVTSVFITVIRHGTGSVTFLWRSCRKLSCSKRCGTGTQSESHLFVSLCFASRRFPLLRFTSCCFALLRVTSLCFVLFGFASLCFALVCLLRFVLLGFAWPSLCFASFRFASFCLDFLSFASLCFLRTVCAVSGSVLGSFWERLGRYFRRSGELTRASWERLENKSVLRASKIEKSFKNNQKTIVL